MPKKVSEWKAELSEANDRALRVSMMLNAVLRGTTLQTVGIDADGICFDLHCRPSADDISNWTVMLVTAPGTKDAYSSVMLWRDFHAGATDRADHSYATALDNLYRIAWAHVRAQLDAARV